MLSAERLNTEIVALWGREFKRNLPQLYLENGEIWDNIKPPKEIKQVIEKPKKVYFILPKYAKNYVSKFKWERIENRLIKQSEANNL
jgi:hypothetical protein